MKFSDVSREDWEANRVYYDTCLLPITGLTGAEDPAQTTAALERLRDAMDKVEIPYKGRIVTYPAFHYAQADSRHRELLRDVCSRLRERTFRHVILLSAELSEDQLSECQADLILDAKSLADESYRTAIARMWTEAARPV